MQNLSVLIKPVSGMCNLKCPYCFYQDEMNHRAVSQYGLMNENTMTSIVNRAFDYAAGGNLSFCFQGGEPMLAGLDFFERFIALVNDRINTNHRIDYSIQTNGTIINQDWMRLFKDHHFLVGISIDGEKKLHDSYRTFHDGSGSFDDVMKTVGLLLDNEVPVNALTVVTQQNVSQARKIYRFLKQHQLTHMQFIPVIDPFEHDQSSHAHQKYAISAKAYEIFLKNLFDVWYKDFMNGIIVNIRFFENILLMLMGYEPESCDMKGHCSLQYVIESNGNVYPCDFYCLDEYLLGNINNESFESLSRAINGTKFVQESYALSAVCISCKWRTLCRGGCRRYRDIGSQNGVKVFKYCQSYRRFFDYAKPRLDEMALMIRQKSMR